MTNSKDAGAWSPGALLHRVVNIEQGERATLLWSFVYFFAVLCAYYILRPVRDEMGVTVGSDGLEALFTIVFVVMLAAVPVFGWVVARFSRPRIVPLVYGFFIANLAVFWALLSGGGYGPFIAGAFFVWASVFNLYVVSLFWSTMSEHYTSEQAKRLYGFIAAGGSAGALAGPLITQSFVKMIGPTNLLLVSILFLALAILAATMVRASMAPTHTPKKPHPQDALSLNSIFAGARRVWNSSYLFQIALWVLLANLVSTYFYFEQARIVGAALADRTDRVQLFARMDLSVSILTLFLQLFVTAHVMSRFGVGAAIAAVGAIAALGLAGLALVPVLGMIVAVVVAERAVGFAISNPAKRVLYTVVPEEDKYTAQNFNDTVVYRGGDAVSGWLFNSVAKGLGISSASVALFTLPFAIAWLVVGLKLGRMQAERADGRQHARSPAV